MKRIVFVATFFIILCSCKRADSESRDKRKNVLFITVDDLRPQLGVYGDTIVKTPHIDKLAKKAIVFDRAYCQAPLCGPSRSSFLSGYYPQTTGAYAINDHIRDTKPNVVTLPQLFKNSGYISAGLYKVFHLVGFDANLFGNKNDPESWSVPLWLPKKSVWGPVGDSIYQINKKKCLEKGLIGYNNIPRSLAYEAPVIADSLLADGEAAQQALRYLEEFKEKPFFMAVGFYNPHLPFVAPKKYWDLYNCEELVLPENQYAPEGVPETILPTTAELRSNVNIPNEGAFTEDLKKDLLHGYLASISYIDAQIGLLLDRLEELKLRENTIVVLLGDHGYQIGEHNLWCKKHSNFEMATRVPLLISIPKHSSNGQRTSNIVELVDVYPTLADLCGLEAPIDLDGKTLVSFFNAPKGAESESSLSVHGGNGNQQSMRTHDYRINRRKLADSTFYELYDHRIDPNENKNVA
ncbi:MAG: sulfatase [Bacteroidota bacterium]